MIITLTGHFMHDYELLRLQDTAMYSAIPYYANIDSIRRIHFRIACYSSLLRELMLFAIG